MKPGDCVIVHSLQNATQHNEKTGRLLEYSKGAGRWTVELDSQRIIVKPANLRLLSEFMPADGFSFAEFTPPATTSSPSSYAPTHRMHAPF